MSVDLDERVGKLVPHHGSHIEQRFAEKILGLLHDAADAADPVLRPAFVSMIEVVKSVGGVEL